MTLTLTAIREHVETDLSDTELMRLMAAATLDVTDFIGQNTSDLVITGGGRYLDLPAAPVEIRERQTNGWVVVPAADYYALGDGRYRRVDGRDWAYETQVTPSPHSLDEQVERAIIHLVQLDIRQRGDQTVTVGDYGRSAPNYERERWAILRSLSPLVIA